MRLRAFLRPGRAIGTPAQPALILLCLMALAAPLALELFHPHRVGIGPLSLLPAVAAAWFLGRPAALTITLLAVLTRLVAGSLGAIDWQPALSVALILPPCAWLVYLAASTRTVSRETLDRERRLQELSFLLDTAQRLSTSLDPEVILRIAVDATAAGVSRGAHAKPALAAYHAVRDGRARITLGAGGDAGLGFEYEVERNQAAVGALRSGRAAIVRPDHLSGELLERLGELDIKVLAMCRVGSGEETHGLLAATARDHAAFDGQGLRRLEVLAHMAGLALANAGNFERERIYGERMAGLEKIKSDILNLVSHELRSPLTVARGYVDMLEDGSLGPLPGRPHSVLRIVGGKLHQIEMLVEQMLEASRLEEGQLPLKPKQVDLCRLTAEAAESARALIGPKHSLELQLPVEPVPAIGDPHRLAAIIGNLINNAVRYSPAGGLVTCALSVHPQCARVTVIDHGLGISSEDMPKLFTRFGRILTPENRGISGTGLGLYLSREIARQHGGDIRVASQTGVGSTFVFELPCAGSPSQPASAASATRQTSSGTVSKA